MKTSLLMIALIALGVALWRDSMRARETAIRICRRECARRALQLLDDTVALAHLRVVWTPRLAFRRVYQFELSADGRSRLAGNISLRGNQVESIHVPDPSLDGPPMPEQAT